MAKILVVDDESHIRTLISKYAVFGGHEIDEAGDGMEAVRLARENTYDLIIMDIMMPVLDGLSACREIRKFSDTPVIMLSARGEEYDKISGFECGADDYVVKPFSPRELMLRADAVMKRAHPAAPGRPSAEIWRKDTLEINLTARRVVVDGKPVTFSPREYDLLFYFVRHPNTALSREKLIHDIWGEDFAGDERTLDTHVKMLRKSLGRYAGLLTTVRGVGYRFDEG